jgi:AraC-like DNA-binding protein
VSIPGRLLVRSGDLDELVGEVSRLMSAHTVSAAAAGPLDARVHGHALSGVSLLHLDYGLPLRLRADPLPDYVALCLPLASSMGVEHGSERFEAGVGGPAYLATPGEELRLAWREGLRLLVVRLDLAPLRRLAARLAGDPGLLAQRLELGPLVESAVAQRAVLGQAWLLHEVVERTGGAPLALAQLREQLMATLLLGHGHSWSAQLARGPERVPRSVVAEAVDVLRARAGEPVTVSEVAEGVGVAVRTLHAAFSRELGVSPKQYLQQLRLDGARDDLLSGEPWLRVGDVAHRWGFANPGRFASAYRRRHGELPSETLERR